MRKTFTLLAVWATIGSFFTGPAFAQAPGHRTCGTVAAEAALQAADLNYQSRQQQVEQNIARFLKNPANRAKVQQTKTIPVVFHVVYNNATENISAAQLNSQIDALNRDFRRANADTANTPNVFRVLGADTQIEFCLASVDPSGNATTGITRTSTTVASFTTNNAIKSTATGGKDAWPRDQYLNIWVCNLTSPLLGYAQSPGGPAPTDGVVLYYTTVGVNPANPFSTPFNKGRTATHEVGHWLGLKHIWADEPACANDDLVADTPLQKDKNYGCPTYPVVTGGGEACNTSDPSSMFMNYMDYTDDACMNIFTKGQRDRMAGVLTTTRASLLTSTACQNTLRANFIANSTNITAGTAINFTDLSTGTPTGWQWTFPGGTPATSNVQNPANIRYNTPGVYDATLTITKGTTTNTRTIPSYITVTNTTACGDTLNLPFQGTPTFYKTTNGYVSGTNGFGDKAKAEYFANTTGYNKVSGGIFGFAKATAANANSTVIVTVWDNTGANGKPGAIIATKTLPINTIIGNLAARQPTTVLFPSPISVSGPFYMGVQLSTTPGDTIALITNQDNDSPAGRAWELQANNTWLPYSTSWNLDVSNAIFPIVTATAPVVNFTSSTASTCVNNTVTFNSSATTGATSYSWSFPGGTPATSTLANPTVTYSTPGTYNVSLTARSGACNLTTTLNKPNVVTVNTRPTISVTPVAATNCTPTPVTLTASGATTYSWSPAAGLSATTGAVVVANPAVTTFYTVVGTTNGCTDTAYAFITVPNIQADFTATPNPVNLNVSGQVTFTNISNSFGFTSWNFGDPNAGAANTSTAATPPPFTYTTPGTYTVTLSLNKSGCYSTKTKTIIVMRGPTGLEEAYEKGAIRIYPNPAKNLITVEVPEKEKVTKVQLINAIGQTIGEQAPTTTLTKLNIENLPNGIYFIKISNAKGSITKKITVLP